MSPFNVKITFLFHIGVKILVGYLRNKAISYNPNYAYAYFHKGPHEQYSIKIILKINHLIKSEFEIRQRPSKRGKNFPGLNAVIMNLKGWLRGIHHHCSGRFINGYFNEFFFRFNRRNFLNNIWHKLIERFMTNQPNSYIANTT